MMTFLLNLLPHDELLFLLLLFLFVQFVYAFQMGKAYAVASSLLLEVLVDVWIAEDLLTHDGLQSLISRTE